MKAKYKQIAQAKPSTETFAFDVLANGNIQISLMPKHYEIMSKAEFEARFEEVKETIATEPETT